MSLIKGKGFDQFLYTVISYSFDDTVILIIGTFQIPKMITSLELWLLVLYPTGLLNIIYSQYKYSFKQTFQFDFQFQLG